MELLPISFPGKGAKFADQVLHSNLLAYEAQDPISRSKEWGRAISARSIKVVLFILPEALSRNENEHNVYLI